MKRTIDIEVGVTLTTSEKTGKKEISLNSWGITQFINISNKDTVILANKIAEALGEKLKVYTLCDKD